MIFLFRFVFLKKVAWVSLNTCALVVQHDIVLCACRLILLPILFNHDRHNNPSDSVT